MKTRAANKALISLLKLWLIVVPVFLIVTASWFYKALRKLGTTTGWQFLATVGFGSVIERTLQLTLLPALLALLYVKGWRRWRDYGLMKGWLRMAPWGVALACAAVVVATVFQIALGAREFKASIPWLAVLAVLPGAAVVALIEEVLFRGVLLQLLAKRMMFWLANLLQALIYAFVHFLSPAGFGSKHEATAWSGIQWLGAVFRQFFDWQKLSDSPALWIKFLALTALGWLMGVSVRACGHIGWAVGFHFGAVWTLLTIRSWTEAEKGWWRPWIGREPVESMDVLGIAMLLCVLQALLAHVESKKIKLFNVF